MSTLFEQASLVMIPSGYKEDVVYSVKPTDGSGDLSFTRASDGTRVNSQGLVERVPWNLLQYSNAFSTAPWSKYEYGGGSLTLTSGQTDPNGGTDAWKFDCVIGTGGSLYTQNVTVNSLGQYNLSVWLKGNVGGEKVRVDLRNSGSSGVTGTTFTLTTEWVRYDVAITNDSGTSRGFQFRITTNETTSNQTFYAYSAQLNEGSLKPYFPTTDRLNVPRLDYSGGCPSLLLEPQRANLLTYSEQFDNAAWDKTSGGAAITANSEISPDGTQNADIITGTGSSVAFVLVRQTVTVPSASTYTFSGFFKYNNHPFVSLNLAAYDGGGSAYFNIQTGVVGTVSAGASATITNYGNGWYRCTLTASIGASDLTGRPSIYVAYEDGTSDFPSTAAASGKAAYAWGAQLEAGTYPTSYIPTTSASVTRVADTASKTGISSLIGQSEGTFFVEATIEDISSNHTFLRAGVTSSFSNSIIIEMSVGVIYGVVYVSSVAQCLIGSPTQVEGNNVKIALAYKANDFALYINGVQIGTDNSGSVPSSVGSLWVGNNSATEQTPIKQALLFPTRLTNAELVSLTTL